MAKVTQLDLTMNLMDLFGRSDQGYDDAYRAVREWIRNANCVLRDEGSLSLKIAEDAKGEFDQRVI